MTQLGRIMLTFETCANLAVNKMISMIAMYLHDPLVNWNCHATLRCTAILTKRFVKSYKVLSSNRKEIAFGNLRLQNHFTPVHTDHPHNEVVASESRISRSSVASDTYS